MENLQIFYRGVSAPSCHRNYIEIEMDVVSVIADHMDFELTKMMQDSPYLGIIVDEFTDLSVRKNRLIYINLLLRDGVVVILFVI